MEKASFNLRKLCNPSELLIWLRWVREYGEPITAALITQMLEEGERGFSDGGVSDGRKLVLTASGNGDGDGYGFWSITSCLPNGDGRGCGDGSDDGDGGYCFTMRDKRGTEFPGPAGYRGHPFLPLDLGDGTGYGDGEPNGNNFEEEEEWQPP